MATAQKISQKQSAIRDTMDTSKRLLDLLLCLFSCEMHFAKAFYSATPPIIFMSFEKKVDNWMRTNFYIIYKRHFPYIQSSNLGCKVGLMDRYRTFYNPCSHLTLHTFNVTFITELSLIFPQLFSVTSSFVVRVQEAINLNLSMFQSVRCGCPSSLVLKSKF